MAVTPIYLGEAADDGLGVDLRAAFELVNSNFAAVLALSGGTLTGTVRETPAAKGNSGSAVTFVLADGNLQTVTWTANCTVTLTPGTGAGRLTILATMDATTRSVTWPGGIVWLTDGGTAPALTGPNETDAIVLIWDGVTWYGFA